MINITRLWTGAEQPADHLRYGQGHGHGRFAGGAAESCAPASSRMRKPIVVWNITRTCNLKCVHCYADASARKFKGELDWEQCCAVIDDLADYKVNALLFSGGEPLVHPRFMELLERATGKGLKVTISTNGTRITPEAAARFKELGVAYVGISLDGIGAVHDKFRGVEGSFEQAVRGFRLCSEVGQKTGLRLTLTRNNVQCMGQILDFIDANDIQRVCFYHLVPTGRGVEVQTLTQEEARNAMDTLIARVEEWKAEGKNREVLTVTQPADGIYLLLRQLREDVLKALGRILGHAAAGIIALPHGKLCRAVEGQRRVVCVDPRRVFLRPHPFPRKIMRRQKTNGKIIGLVRNLRHRVQRILVAVGQRGDGRLLAWVLSIKASRGKLTTQPPAQHAQLSALDERRHRHGQRGILRNFRQEICLGVQIRHQFAAVPHQKEVNVVVVIVDGVEQPQQAALHSPKLHRLGEDENGVFHLCFFLSIDRLCKST